MQRRQAAACPEATACHLFGVPCPTRIHRKIDRSPCGLEIASGVHSRPFGGPAVSDGFRRPVGFASLPCGKFALVGGEGNLTSKLCQISHASDTAPNAGVRPA
jgi:hypothetical protein